MILAATGHRPDKLGGYDDATLARLTKLAERALFEHNATSAISGMALGWDTAFALAALNLKLPLTAAIPFEGQDAIWPEASKNLYAAIRRQATQVVVVSKGGFSSAAMHRRNEWMVDHCDKVVALFDGSPGGTWNCIKYAQRVGKPVVNYWREWQPMSFKGAPIEYDIHSPGLRAVEGP